MGIREDPSHGGMDRFFSPENLDRYRILASSKSGVEERKQVIARLAREMAEFRKGRQAQSSRITPIGQARPELEKE